MGIHRRVVFDCPGLLLEIEIAERLTIGVVHDEAGGLFLKGPGRREAGGLVTAFSFRVWWYWQLGDICVTAPNRRPAAITKIVAQIECAHSGEVKDDSAEESKADYSSRGYQSLPEWSVGWWRKRLHFRLSNVGQVAMPLAGRPGPLLFIA